MYTYNVIKALADLDKENKYVIFFDRALPEGYFKGLTNENPNFSYKILPSFPFWTQFNLALHLILNPVDVFFTAVHTMPIIRRRKMKIVGMIHGLEYATNTSKSKTRRFLAAPVRFLAKNADFIIVPSEYTKKSLLEASWGVKEQKIAIIPEGVGSEFEKKSKNEVEEVLKKHELEEGKYLISVSTIQPRKNYPVLIEAFRRVLEVYPDLKLVICGKKGWEYEETFNAPKKFGVSDKVVFLGRVPDQDLPALLSGSRLFVSASLEEGFGLPLLEAMACEVGCAVSDISAFRDIGKNYMVYFDPTDVLDISGKILIALKSVDVDVIRLAKLRSLDFTWNKTAERTLEVFRKYS